MCEKCQLNKEILTKNKLFYLCNGISFVQTNKEVKQWISLTEKQPIFTATIPQLCDKQTNIKVRS